MGYEKINFIKCLKVSRAPRVRISNKNSGKKRREPFSRKLKKVEDRE